jgi:hypothetical protein
MIPIATPFKEFYVDHHQIQVLDTPGYQGTDLQASGLFVGAHRREVVVLKFASFGEGGISRLFCLDVLVSVQRVQRADERTRTADLISLRMINQALQGFAGVCKYPISKRFPFPWLAGCCTVLRSRWCQNGVRVRKLHVAGSLAN